MGLFSNEKKDNEKMIKGWTANVFLPDYDNNQPFVGLSKGGFFGGTTLNSNKKRQITTKVALKEKGIVVKQGQLDGSDLRILWENIVKAEKEIVFGISITLVDGKKIQIQNAPAFVSKNNVIKYLNENANGKIEDGWD